MKAKRRPYIPGPRTWRTKFAAAFRGWYWGVKEQNSFHVHFPVAITVVAAAAWFRVTPGEWLALVLSIALVLAAELFNSALETLAPAITREHDEHVARALDIASGAVLCLACGAVVVGAVIFLPRL